MENQVYKEQRMECKFKQIKNLTGPHTLPVRSSQPAVNQAISCLLGNVADHVYSKTALQKSKTFLKNKIINFEIDSVKQVYPPHPSHPYKIKEEQSPRIAFSESLRPMSAQIHSYSRENHHHRNTVIATDSKKTIESRGSLASYFRTKRNTTSLTNVAENDKKKRKYYKKTNSNEKRFFAVKSTCEDDEFHANFIEELRQKKVLEENQAKKKDEFLRSIQIDSNSYSTAQAKFIQSVNRKKFIYGPSCQIIEINGNLEKTHLKKISAMSKSRVQIKPKSNDQLKKFQQDLKENIYIEFKGRDTHQTYQNRPQTGKPSHSQKLQEMKSKFFSVKETKRQPQEGLQQMFGKNLDNKLVGTQREKESKRTGQNENKALVKKKVQKILFYQSPNSVYRVVNDCLGSGETNKNTNDKFTIEDM